MKRRLIVCSVWSLVLLGIWWAYSGAEPPKIENPPEGHPVNPVRIEMVSVDVDGSLWPDVTQPNHTLVIRPVAAKPQYTLTTADLVDVDGYTGHHYPPVNGNVTTGPPERQSSTLVAKAPPTIPQIIIARDALTAAMDLARLRIIWDLVENGNVTTPANYASSKVDHLDIAKVTKYGYPFLRVHCKWSQEKIDSTTADEQALAIIDNMRWYCTFPYKSELADMKATQAAAVAAAEKDIATDFGTAEYVPPVADAGGPYTGTCNSPVAFDGSGSTDDGSIASYSWDCGDSGTETGEAPSHTYTSPGEYTVTLTVTDDRDLTAEAETTATITAAP